MTFWLLNLSQKIPSLDERTQRKMDKLSKIYILSTTLWKVSVSYCEKWKYKMCSLVSSYLV